MARKHGDADPSATNVEDPPPFCLATKLEKPQNLRFYLATQFEGPLPLCLGAQISLSAKILFLHGHRTKAEDPPR